MGAADVQDALGIDRVRPLFNSATMSLKIARLKRPLPEFLREIASFRNSENTEPRLLRSLTSTKQTARDEGQLIARHA
jgi:hypothetical protein